MTITTSKDGTKVTFALEGRLDTLTSPDFENETKANIADAEKVVVDFAKLDYISSAGLRVLLNLHKTMAAKQGLTLVNVSESIMDIFDVTGFKDILDIA